jgi:hypothetical protein
MLSTAAAGAAACCCVLQNKKSRLPEHHKPSFRIAMV